MTDLAFQCRCGALKGSVMGASPSVGTHAECFCASCRAAELYSGAPDPAPGPVGIFQTTPHRIELTSGQEHLAVFSFGEKNLLRWQASCCGSTLFNTPRNPKLSFVGIRTNLFADPTAIGPVVAQAFIAAAQGKTKHKGLLKVVGGALKRIAISRVTGRWKETPFFDPSTLEPTRAVTVLPKGTRDKVLP